MASNSGPRQRKNNRYGEFIWVAAITAAIVFLASLFAYVLHWDATGIPSKNLWDWATLLIIPVLLAYGGLRLSQIQQERERDAETRQRDREKRWDFMKRVREVEATILTARLLLVANDSGRTWVIQLQRLIELSVAVAGIIEDLKESRVGRNESEYLFDNQEVDVENKLTCVKNYLNQAKDQYLAAHPTVDKEAKEKQNTDGTKEEGKKLKEIIEITKKAKTSKTQQWDLSWTEDFMNKVNESKDCDESLTTVKNKMLSKIYRA